MITALGALSTLFLALWLGQAQRYRRATSELRCWRAVALRQRQVIDQLLDRREHQPVAFEQPLGTGSGRSASSRAADEPSD